MTPSIALLIVLLVLWCALHSGMIAARWTDLLKRRLGLRYRYYRLFFNVVALATLAPIVVFEHSLRGNPILSWTGPLAFVRIALLLVAAVIVLAAIREYNMMEFSGLRHLRRQHHVTPDLEPGGLQTTGILAVTRHPWYLATLLFVWARQDLDFASIAVGLVLTCYLLVGTLLEERKLIREFGDRYRRYQREVSMLFPVKWLSVWRRV